MAGKVLNVDHIVSKDALGIRIADYWVKWKTFRHQKERDLEELRRYVYAVDTRTTANSKLPWKNSTTIPKLCQVRDNLYANYMAAMFPKRKWYQWDAANQDSNQREKRDSITGWMSYTTEQDRFKLEMGKCVLDYIDAGNAFGTIDWVDERSSLSSPPVQVGYVGPVVRRINPLDIVFNPISPSFLEAPKIIRSIVSMGEVKKILEAQTTDENRSVYENLFKYLKDLRATVRNNPGADLQVHDAYMQVDGFTSYRAYLDSDYVELLTFYGDVWNQETEEYLQNHKIIVVDRHKVISQAPNPSYFGFPPIFHVGWRPRQDNLWAMGPLDNLVGLQYRLDHVENLKADVFDLLTFPPLKIKGYVEEFTWGPMEKIYTGDEGDVEMLAPPFQILQANLEIQYLTTMMEEMAGSPKEAMGFRTPGEKTAYEVQRLENAASRIFQSKIVQFEEQFVERLLNAMLEMSRRHMDGVFSVPVFDNEFKVQVFMSLTPSDITGSGRLKPIAARHFAERAEVIQNINNFYNSGPGQDPEVRQHVSSVKMAQMTEELLDLQDYGLFLPYVRISEQADAQRLSQVAQEQTQMELMTPSGLHPDDTDEPVMSPEMMPEA